MDINDVEDDNDDDEEEEEEEEEMGEVEEELDNDEAECDEEIDSDVDDNVSLSSKDSIYKEIPMHSSVASHQRNEKCVLLMTRAREVWHGYANKIKNVWRDYASQLNQV